MSDLMEAVLTRDELAHLDAPARRLALRTILRDNDALAALPQVVERIDGYDVLGPLMRDREVTDILVNGHREVWAERSGSLVLTEISFGGSEDLYAFVERMLGRVGRRADPSHPIEDARLPDGSRMHVVMPPLAGEEPVVSIRRFAPTPWDLDDLVERGAMTAGSAAVLRDLVRERATVLVAGPTGSGKTTLVDALLTLVPSSERIVTIEETRELRRAGGHHVALVARPPNADGSGEVDLDALLRAALRMRPDRIVIGEVRGREAAVAVDALSTGHRGGLLTIHAHDAEGALARLRRLASAGRPGLDEAYASDAIDAVVVMERVNGARRVREIAAT